MEYPVCMDDRRVGTLYVSAAGGDTDLRTVCRGVGKGLYRLYLRGGGGEVSLGVTEDGCLHRVFSPALLAPAGGIRCAVLRRCGGDASRPGLLARLPPEAHTVWRGGLRGGDDPVAGGAAVPAGGAVLLRPPGTGERHLSV